jgi:predicted DNA-binding transcriptional regulator AlpA
MFNNDDVVERPKDFAAALGISLATLWRRVKREPGFPQPVTLSEHASGFLRSERMAYIARLVRERDARLAVRKQQQQQPEPTPAPVTRARGRPRKGAR